MIKIPIFESKKVPEPITYGDLKVGVVIYSVFDLVIDRLTVTDVSGGSYQTTNREGDGTIHHTKGRGSYSTSEKLYGTYFDLEDAIAFVESIFQERMDQYRKKYKSTNEGVSESKDPW